MHTACPITKTGLSLPCFKRAFRDRADSFSFRRATFIPLVAALLIFVALTGATGCDHGEPLNPIEKFVGIWQLKAGDKDVDCGAGPIREQITNVHQVRMVEGSDGDLLLQFFEGREANGPVVCEFPYVLKNSTAVLAEEHSCTNGGLTVTWHSGKAIVSGFGDLVLTTRLTDEAGCIEDVRPIYFLYALLEPND